MIEIEKIKKDYKNIFLDDKYINSNDFEEEIDNSRNNYFFSDDEISLTLPVFETVQVAKPKLSFEDIGELHQRHDYYAEEECNTALVNKNENVLNRINELIHSITMPIYIIGKELFEVEIYADKMMGWRIIDGRKTLKRNYK